MKNEINNYIYSQWKHREGFESNWLRRITRQSKTQLICDVQRTLLLSDKYKKMYDAGHDYMMGVYPRWAKRFKIKNNDIKESITHLHNTDGVRKSTLLNGDFSKLLCPHKYEDLFNVDIRPLFEKDSITISSADDSYNVHKDIFTEDRFYFLSVEPVTSDHDYYGNIAGHLYDLFKVPVYKVYDLWFKINTIHDRSIYNSGIKYHINHYGGDVPIITSKENRKNRTISFWLFEDKVVFKTEDGIDAW
jgi:hypothetical protein